MAKRSDSTILLVAFLGVFGVGLPVLGAAYWAASGGSLPAAPLLPAWGGLSDDANFHDFERYAEARGVPLFATYGASTFGKTYTVGKPRNGTLRQVFLVATHVGTNKQARFEQSRVQYQSFTVGPFVVDVSGHLEPPYEFETIKRKLAD